MRIKHYLKEREEVEFGTLDAGDMFIDIESNNIMLKMNNEFEGTRNAVFMDGTSWNFDDGDMVSVILEITLED